MLRRDRHSIGFEFELEYDRHPDQAAVKRFLEFLMRPATVGVAVGIMLSVFFVSIQGPAHCRDGWRSPSIGRPGACSHHGRVAPSPLVFELLLSALAGL
jgi:hypothetical protein